MSESAALQSQIGNYSSSFADGQAAVSNYVSNYDTTFFDDWNNKIAQVRQKGQTIASVSGSGLGLQIAGKAAYAKYYGDNSGGDEEGVGGAEGEGGTEMEDIASTGGDSGAGAAGGGGSGGAAGGDSGAGAAADGSGSAAADGGGGADATADLSSSFDLEAGVGETTLAGDAAVAVGDAAAAVGSAASTAASTIAAAATGEAAVAAGSLALTAVPILGAVGGLVFGLYELFHHDPPPKKPAQAPGAPVTASARAENVLPNVDGVVDAPASVAAF